MRLHFYNAAVSADVENFAAELVCEIGNSLQVLVLVTKRFAKGKLARMEILSRFRQALLDPFGGSLVHIVRSDLTVVCEQLLEVFGAEDVDLSQEKFALDKSGVRVVKDGPYGYQVLDLTTCLLDDAVLAGQNDRHPRQILNLRVADDERIDVEPPGGENPGNTGQNTRLVLDKAVQNVTLRRLHRRGRGLVEDVGHSRLGGPGRRLVDGKRRRAAADGFVGHGCSRLAG